MTDAAPVIFVGGADALQLAPDGPVYHPGDEMPKGFGGDQRLSLQAAGFRFVTRHDDAPAPMPAEMPADAPAEDAPAKTAKSKAGD